MPSFVLNISCNKKLRRFTDLGLVPIQQFPSSFRCQEHHDISNSLSYCVETNSLWNPLRSLFLTHPLLNSPKSTDYPLQLKNIVLCPAFSFYHHPVINPCVTIYHSHPYFPLLCCMPSPIFTALTFDLSPSITTTTAFHFCAPPPTLLQPHTPCVNPFPFLSSSHPPPDILLSSWPPHHLLHFSSNHLGIPCN